MIPGSLSASTLKFMLNFASSSSTSTGAFSAYIGFYSHAGTSIALASSLSSSWSWGSSTASTGWGGYSGNRYYEVTCSLNFTPGDWWAASVIRTAGGNFSMYGYSLASVVSLNAMPAGSTTANSFTGATNAFLAYYGVSNAAWTATSMPAAIASNETGFLYSTVTARRLWFALTSF